MAHDNTVYRGSSWGRTRGPKNITGPNQTPVAVTDCGSLVAAAAGTGVCVTENQRYLHITTAAGASVSNIWAYMHASKQWAELKTLAGAPHAVAEETHQTFEIAGIDKVAFNIDGVVYAAASTF
jgi:hypothetical protein